MNLTKTIALFTIILLVALLSNCHNRTYLPIESDLHGQWYLSRFEINGHPSSNFIERPPFTYFGLQSNQTYYLGFYSGTWAVIEDRLLMYWLNDYPLRDYQILYRRPDSLVVETKTTEQYFMDIPQFEPNDTFRITEYYGRKSYEW